jgi:hypothetical protein
MRLSAIAMSRVIGIPARFELNPFGRAFVPSLVPRITERYRFMKSPTSFEDAAKDGGLVFEQGYAEECGTITKLTAYEQGFSLESRAHSSDGKATILGLYKWICDEHGLSFNESSIKKWLYVTDLLFYSDASLDDLNPSLNILRQAMTKLNEDMGRPSIPFVTTQIVVNHDKNILDFPQTSFTVARDLSAAFTENKYYSESPFPSEKHIEILEEFERSVLKYAGR